MVILTKPERCRSFWGAHAPWRVPTGALAGSEWRTRAHETVSVFGRLTVFREGTKNCTRGACAPHFSRFVPATPASGYLMTELMVAMAIILIALLPLVAVHVSERRLERSCYERAVVMEVVDGEMESLLAGEWKAFPEGTTTCPLSEAVKAELPPGTLSLTVNDKDLRLEWAPAEPGAGGPVAREGRIP